MRFSIISALLLSIPAFVQASSYSSPTAGDQWAIGKEQSIEWDTTGLEGKVDCHLVPGGATDITTIITEIFIQSDNTGSFKWTPDSSLKAEQVTIIIIDENQTKLISDLFVLIVDTTVTESSSSDSYDKKHNSTDSSHSSKSHDEYKTKSHDEYRTKSHDETKSKTHEWTKTKSYDHKTDTHHRNSTKTFYESKGYHTKSVSYTTVTYGSGNAISIITSEIVNTIPTFTPATAPGTPPVIVSQATTAVATAVATTVATMASVYQNSILVSFTSAASALNTFAPSYTPSTMVIPLAGINATAVLATGTSAPIVQQSVGAAASNVVAPGGILAGFFGILSMLLLPRNRPPRSTSSPPRRHFQKFVWKVESMSSIDEKTADSHENTISSATKEGDSVPSTTDNYLEPPKRDQQDVSEATSVTGVESIDAEKGESTAITPEAPPRDITGVRWALVVISILSSTFLFALDNTIVADIQPVIVTHFNAVDKLTWLSVAFLIGAAATNLLWGKIFGQFNAKWTYILCVFLFEVGSAICGSAPSIDALIIGRTICGIGGSGMYVGVMTLLAATTTIQERPMYVGGTGLTWGLGTVLGPIIGGAFSDSSAGWRWSFYINLCIGAACAPVYIFMLPNKDPRPGVSLLDRAREMDYVGSVLTMGAFVSGVMALSFGGVTYPWNSGKIIGLFVCSGVLFIILGLQQVYTIFTTTTRRLFPVEFFSSRTILILFCMTAAGGTAIFVPIYMIPIFFQFTRSDTALEAGVRLLPFIMLMIFAVIFNGAVLSSYGLYMPWYTVGGLFVLAGGALMYTVDQNTSIARVYGYSILIGFGDGLFAQASFSVAQAIVEPQFIASAVGFITCAQVSGVTIALAIANSVFLNKSQQSISALLPDVPLSDIQAAIAGAGSSFVGGLSDTVKEEVLEAIVSAMSKTYVLVIVAGTMATLLSFAMKRERLFMVAGHAG
ncbi:hypothetical protein G7Y89_g11829 [Cudoniella acicularis]|uniref:Major facilitator superfamily (MFS) profile domain-containing protein n=1 Tax=Cudoniella acicularis TaxID=354080 RepID=A0A8H4RA59_9HELO|nr:hypothetical protein G7Y89_g11829 [Cudoniella acicularis]